MVMMAWMNDASLKSTIETGKTHFEPITPEILDEGQSSGHMQEVKDIAFDCDGDTLLIRLNSTELPVTRATNPVFSAQFLGKATSISRRSAL